MAQTGQGAGSRSGRVIGFMNALDALFLYLESPETPMHIGSMHVFDPPPGRTDDLLERLRGHLAGRLDQADVFTRRIAPMPLAVANPAWIRAEEIDLDHHVRRLRLPAPGNRAQLHDAVASLHARLLDRHRPLWEMVLIEGLDDGRIGFYAKVHHAGLDGQAGVALAQAVYDLAGRTRGGAAPALAGDSIRRTGAGPAPGVLEVLAAGVRHNAGVLAAAGAGLPGAVRAALSALRGGGGIGPGVQAVRSLLGGGDLLAPRTPLNVSISRRRAFATVSVPLARARAIGERHEATVNDVVLAACGAALVGWLDERGARPPAPLLAAVPVSLRAAGDEAANTQALIARVTLGTDADHPLDRLRRVRNATRALKRTIGPARSVVPTDVPSFGLPWIGNLLAAAWGRSGLPDRLPPLANVLISNVPGPQVPLSMLGATMRGYWPVSIPIHGMALNITVQSYAGSLDFGLIACRRAVPDVDRIARRIAAAFDALEGDEKPAPARGRAPRARRPTAAPASAPASARPRRRRAP
jgi:WS/DGAT/MGAT family acyltransferase